MFNNLKIGVRLGLGFALVLIFLIIISSLGVFRVAAIGSEVENLASDKLPKVIWSQEMVDNVNVVARALRNAVMYSQLKDEANAQRQLDRVGPARQIVTDRFEKLEKLITNPKAKEQLALIKAKREVYLGSQNKTIDLIKAHKIDEAATEVLGTGREQLDAYFAAVQGLINIQTELAKEQGEEAVATANSTRNLVLSLAAAAALLSILAGLSITRSLTQPIRKLVDTTQKMAAGDFSTKLDLNSQDETGELANALRALHSAVQAMSKDATMLVKAAVEGKLATRADASQHKGDFQNIVLGVNQTLDAVIGPLNVTADYVDKISKGVIPPIITDNYNGDFNVIKTNLNNMVKMMSDLLAQTDIIIQGAANGELDKRADATMFVGCI